MPTVLIDSKSLQSRQLMPFELSSANKVVLRAAVFCDLTGEESKQVKGTVSAKHLATILSELSNATGNVSPLLNNSYLAREILFAACSRSGEILYGAGYSFINYVPLKIIEPAMDAMVSFHTNSSTPLSGLGPPTLWEYKEQIHPRAQLQGLT
jgi:hypothetical protein